MPPWQMREPSGLQVPIDGRLVDVSSVGWWDGTTEREVSNLYVPTWVAGPTPDPDPDPDPPPPTGLPAAPAGYKSWYEIDFRNIGTRLPTGWVAQNTGPANAGASYRAQNVAVVPGKGLVHYAERAYVGAPAYSGKVFARLGIPMFAHTRFRAYIKGFKRGVWPSGWMRPQNSHEGEIDMAEWFGGHLYPYQSSGARVFGGGFIATPYPDKGHLHWDFDPLLGVPSNNQWIAAMEDPHTVELQVRQGEAQMWFDGKNAGVRNSSNMSAGQNLYNAQFNTASNTWYFRTDLQISGNRDMTGGAANAGDSNAGPLSNDQVGRFAEWVFEYFQVFVPNSYSGAGPTI